MSKPEFLTRDQADPFADGLLPMLVMVPTKQEFGGLVSALMAAGHRIKAFNTIPPHLLDEAFLEVVNVGTVRMICCGPGKVDSATVTAIELTQMPHYRQLLLLGACGAGPESRAKRGDLVAIANAIQSDLDLRPLTPNSRTPIKRSNYQQTNILQLPNIHSTPHAKITELAQHHSIYTGDKVQFEVGRLVDPTSLVDMETAAVAQAVTLCAGSRNDPCTMSCVRVVTDIVGEDRPEDLADALETYMGKLVPHLVNLVHGIASQKHEPAKLPTFYTRTGPQPDPSKAVVDIMRDQINVPALKGFVSDTTFGHLTSQLDGARTSVSRVVKSAVLLGVEEDSKALPMALDRMGDGVRSKPTENTARDRDNLRSEE